MDNITYKLVNKNLLLSIILGHDDYTVIFSNMLTMIDDYLSVMVNNNIKMDNLNFDHLVCVEYSQMEPSHTIYHNIIRCIKFDIKKFIFVNVDDDTDFFGSIKEHSYLINNIKNKLQTKQKIIHNKPKESSPKIIKYDDTPKKEIPKVVIPIEDPKVTIPVETPKVEEPIQDPEEILKMIETLKKLKEEEVTKITSLKEKLEKEEDILNEKQNILGDIKRDSFKHKEKEEDNKRVFIADKKAYFMIKMDIYTKKLEENKISPLFQDKYIIFKYLDERGILGTDDEYVHYVTLYNELYPKPEIIEDRYVPHNLHYLSEEEQKKYENIKNKDKDMIEEFINGKSKIVIEPLDDVLRKVDEDNNYEDDKNNMFGDVDFTL